jgi:glycerol-3-phosphate dehydrogenase (NAD(P)+)
MVVIESRLVMESQRKIITVIGAGFWGSTLASVVSRNQHQVRLWCRRSQESLAAVVADADIIISAVSMPGVRPISEQLQQLELPPNIILVTATKGLDPLTTCTPSQIWQAALPEGSIVVLSGPNLSQEIRQGLPAATAVASKNIAAAELVQQVFSCDSFRVYANSDPLGTELGGTLKNIMAIAAGVCDGLHLGTNAKAALLTRALREMIRVGTHLGARTETFFGLSGLGDLLATCNSMLSRNYQVGYGLAQGKSIEQILAELAGTAEGINTTKVLIEIANQQNLRLPISQQVYFLLQQQTTPLEAVKSLMERNLTTEF